MTIAQQLKNLQILTKGTHFFSPTVGAGVGYSLVRPILKIFQYEQTIQGESIISSAVPLETTQD